jgi:hypothetical protein
MAANELFNRHVFDFVYVTVVVQKHVHTVREKKIISLPSALSHVLHTN